MLLIYSWKDEGDNDDDDDYIIIIIIIIIPGIFAGAHQQAT